MSKIFPVSVTILYAAALIRRVLKIASRVVPSTERRNPKFNPDRECRLMPRRRETQKREIIRDPKYKDVTVAKFINIVMKRGKKSIAEKIVYGALDHVAETHPGDDQALGVFNSALNNVKPQVEVKSRRVGGATYQVPVEVRPARQMTLAMRWLIWAARKRRAKSTGIKLAHEMMDAAENKGAAVKKREDTIKMAEANKAFAHYRW